MALNGFLTFKDEIKLNPPIESIEKKLRRIPSKNMCGEKKSIFPFHSLIFIVITLAKILMISIKDEYIMPEESLPIYIDLSGNLLASNVSKLFDVRSRIIELATGPITMKQLNQTQ